MRVLLVALALAASAPGVLAEVPVACAVDIALGVDHDNAIVQIDWSPAPGVTTYFVGRELDGGPVEVIAMVPHPTTTHTDSPAPDGVLTYRVGIDQAPVASDACEAEDVHIGGEQPFPEPRCLGPLFAQALPGAEVRVTWPPPFPPAQTIDVLRAVGAGPLVPHALVDPSKTEFVDTGLDPGEVYRYAVVADGVDSSCPTVEVTAVPFSSGLVAGLVLAVGAIGSYLVWRRRG